MMRGLPYAELAARVMQPFVGGSIPFEVLRTICQQAYAGFTHTAVVPLIQLETSLFTQELSTALRWPSKTWLCRCSVVCSTMC